MSMVTCSWKCQWLLRKQSNHYCQEPLVYRLTSSVSEIFLQLAKGTRIPLLSHHQQSELQHYSGKIVVNCHYSGNTKWLAVILYACDPCTSLDGDVSWLLS